jgi:APA family basic amino acid/polyamine antiporter
VHKVTRVPYISTGLVLLVAVVTAGFLSVDVLVEMVNIGMLTAYLLTSIGILVMRVKHPEYKRPFKVPAIWIIAPLAVIGNIILVVGLPKVTLIRFLIWLVCGLFIYGFYGFRHSKLTNDKSQKCTDIS